MAQQGLRRAEASPTAASFSLAKGYDSFNSSSRGSAQSRSGETLRLVPTREVLRGEALDS